MLKRTISPRRFFWVPTTYILVEKYEINFQLHTFIWRPVKHFHYFVWYVFSIPSFFHWLLLCGGYLISIAYWLFSFALGWYRSCGLWGDTAILSHEMIWILVYELLMPCTAIFPHRYSETECVLPETCSLFMPHMGIWEIQPIYCHQWWVLRRIWWWLRNLVLLRHKMNETISSEMTQT